MVWKSINSKPQPCAMTPILTSPSGEQYRTVEEKMDAIANVSFPTKSCRLNRSQTSCNSFKNSHDEQETDFTVCPKMLKRLLRTAKNCSEPGLDGIGWQELEIWFLVDPSGLCELFNYLINSGLPPDLKLARVVGISKPGRRDRKSVKAYRCISLLPTIAKLVGKVITLYLSTKGEINGWWHTGKHGSWAGRNTMDALLWLIRKARENRSQKKHTAVLMVDVPAAFPNTSDHEVRKTLADADPKVARWIDE
jgi:hypothetical protein